MSTCTTHRILTPGGPLRRFLAVGRCIYCNRTPPEARLSDEHIIADGLGGDLLLPDASCVECATATCRAEQQVLREMLRLPRGALGVRSRKKRLKQTSIRVQVGPDDARVEKDIPFASGIPPWLVLFETEQGPPGILRGAPPEEKCTAHLVTMQPPRFWERTSAIVGSAAFQLEDVRMHIGVIGQVVAKTAHAFAVAVLGADQFTPFLTEYVRTHEPPFDGYYMASLPNRMHSDALHEITLRSSVAPRSTAIGVFWPKVYVVHVRLFAMLSAPEFQVVVGKPV